MNINLELQKNIVTKYLYAKDNNKPHLMKDIFCKDAVLNMELKTENISFPSETIGLDFISKVLIKEFNNSYENVYSFCFLDSLNSNNDSLTCKWLVVMSSKENNLIRVGYGTYIWSFDNKSSLVKKLVIKIEEMIILEESLINEIMNWIGEVSYPWCDTKYLLNSMPELEVLNHIKNI